MTRISPAQWLSQLFGVGRGNRKRLEAPVEPAAVRRGDSLEVSSRARAALEAQKALEDVPETRQDRVEALRLAIQNGTYRPDPRQVAQKILDAGAVERE